MSLANSSVQHATPLAEPQPGRRPAAVVAAAVAGAAAAAGIVKKAVRGSSDEEILQRMRARPNLLMQHRPSPREVAHPERIGGNAPART